MRALFRRMLMLDFWKGMVLTFRYQNPNKIYTEQYPLDTAPWWPSAIAAPRA